MDRWEWLEGIKAESVVSVAVKHMARLVADELLDWPPHVATTDQRFYGRFGEVLQAGSPRPARAAYDEALRCARWELARDFEAIEYYDRNNKRAQACPEPRDRLASEFIQHYVLEAFFVLMEKTDYRVKRKDVVAGLDGVERRLSLSWDAD